MEKYELIKSIRFKLKPISLNEKFINSSKQDQNTGENELSIFLDYSKQVISLFTEFVFKKQSQQTTDSHKKQSSSENTKNSSSLSLSNSITIKFRWLKNHTKSDFFKQISQTNKREYLIKEICYLKQTLTDCIKEWNDITSELTKKLQAPQENLSRKSEIALLINKFSQKQIFPFIKDFIYESKHKKDDTLKNKLEVELNKLEKSLEKLKDYYRSAQSSGVILAKSSLNFYTVNKTPTDYSDKKAKYEQKLKLSPHTTKPFHKMIKKWLEVPKNKQDMQNKGLYVQDLRQLDLQQWYQLIKSYKAKERQSFDESIDQIISSKKINCQSPKKIINKHPLFKCSLDKIIQYMKNREKFQKFNQQNQQSKKIALNQNINRTRSKIKKFFQYDTKQYNDLCKVYQNIAKEHGDIKNKLRSIEREKTESQLLNYWSVILEEKGKHYLLLIHRHDMSKAKDYIESKQGTKGSLKLHLFSSLTLRALDKLCFRVSGDFLQKIKEELSQYEDVKGKFSFQNNEKELDEKKLIQFYQNVLSTSYANRVLDQSLIESLKSRNILKDTFTSLDRFRSALEQVCYLKKIYAIDNSDKIYLLKNYNVNIFEITSFDLRDHNKEIKIKPHTELWNTFWSTNNKEKNYPTRINPELSLLWRKKLDNKLRFFDPQLGSSNRFSQDQYTLKTTFTLNASSRTMDISFHQFKDVKEKIEHFNKKFYQNTKKEGLFYYGMDRGKIRQTVLCITKEDPSNDKKISFAPIEVLKLKEKYYDEKWDGKHQTVKNLSYVMQENSLFEKKKTATIDLTTAKLIHGKIVENGDIMSYLKFKEIDAKRVLFEHKSNLARQQIFTSKDNTTLHVKIHNRGKEEFIPIYYFNTNFKNIVSLEKIKNNLETYLNRIEDNPNQEMIYKINHLHSAMANNTIGILAFLHRQNPGLMILETNQQRTTESIAKSLEWALYKKFQTECLVPPRLGAVDLLLKQVQSLGLIYFIDPHQTSKKCPKCNNITSSDDNKKQGYFQCTNSNCNFDTQKPDKNFIYLDDPDKLAAYNICRVGRKKFIGLKSNLRA